MSELALFPAYAAIAPSEPYRGTTKFTQSDLDPAKQKAGYHHHDDPLPLRSLFYFALTYVVQMIETEPQSSR